MKPKHMVLFSAIVLGLGFLVSQALNPPTPPPRSVSLIPPEDKTAPPRTQTRKPSFNEEVQGKKDAPIIADMKPPLPPLPKSPKNLNLPSLLPVELQEPEENFSSRWELSKEGIDAAIFERMGEILQCYQTALFHEPTLEGRVKARFRVESSEDGSYGYVAAVDIDDALNFDPVMMKGCIATIMEELQFEPPADGGVVTIHYPFIFTSG